MPLVKEWESDPYSLAAIWKIEEPEAFFAEQTGMNVEIKNDKRRIERLAGRHLLKHLKRDFPLLHISPDEHDKPRIPSNQYFFSISHSWPYVAAVVSPYAEAGIDLQCWHPRMEVLQHKFLGPKEQLLVNNDRRQITLAWSAKEAAYKWQGKRGVEFIDHLPIVTWEAEGEIFNIIINLELSNPKRRIRLQGAINEDYACAFVENSASFLNSSII